MNNQPNAFRGRVIEKYGTIGKFAEAMHWSGRKASYVTTGRQQLTVDEAATCAEVLDVDNAQDFLRIFYPKMSIKWTD